METDDAGVPFAATIHESLGIHTVEATPDRVVTEMEVGPKVLQPFGIMHGGASAVLAESAASLGAYLSADPPRMHALGIELSVSHLKALTSGKVRAVATPLRRGRTIQVWTIALADQDGNAVAAARCTLAIRPARDA
ncbi:MAG: PaaI family thioesterase [Actinomycetota bacterium]